MIEVVMMDGWYMNVLKELTTMLISEEPSSCRMNVSW